MRYRETRVLGALAVFAMVSPVATAAQTRFPAPDTTVNFARYATPDDCLAAVTRMRIDLDRQKLAQGADTLYNPDEALAPAPAAVTATAEHCAARFAVATVDLDDYKSAVQLFLAAGRDSDAVAMVARRLAAIAPTDTAARGTVADSLFTIYADARPARMALAEALLLGRARGGTSRFDRLKRYGELLQASMFVGDTARTRRAAQWVVALADSLTPAERQLDQFAQAGGEVLVFLAMRRLGGLERSLDSLRKSTAAFVALERTYWSQATKERGDALPDIGKRAAVLTADYWFPGTAAAVAHPTPGSVTLIVFLSPQVCAQEQEPGDFTDWVCGRFLGKVRRIAHRFPALKIDVVASTRGAFMYVPPPTPAEEAVLLAQWVDSARVPGAVLGVTATPFLKLPEPDGRRVNRDRPNLVHYGIQAVGPTEAVAKDFVVDADGIIVQGSAPIVGAWDEAELTQMIDALLHQPRAGN